VTENEAVRGLRGAAKRRESADRKRREATDDLKRFAREAQKAGVSMSQIAREAGVSRQGLYDLLADPRPS
jgi:AcrR family transcriptional regulator